MSDKDRAAAESTVSPDGMDMKSKKSIFNGKDAGGGKKKNKQRSNRIILFVLIASATVLMYIILSLTGDDGKGRQKGPKISRVTAASTSGLTLQAPPEPEPDFNIDDLVSDDVIPLPDAVPEPEPEKTTVRIVMKQPSDVYRQRRSTMLVAMGSNTKVQFNDSEYEDGDHDGAQSGGANGPMIASGGYDDPNQQLGYGMNSGMGMMGSVNPADNSVAMAHQDRNIDFISRVGSQSAENEYNPKTRRGSKSQYELKAGTIISGVLTNGINSDLPGVVLGQVSENIYDSATGAHLLVPQGSKVIGEYDSHIVYGQHRILVVWTRIIFPDGTSLNIGGLTGSDQAGYSGLKQKIDNHYSRMIGAALFASVFVTAGKVATDNDKNNDGTQTKAAEAVMEQMSSLGARIAEKNLNVAPTLRILPGFRFSIITTKDMAFAEPYSPVVY